MKIEILEAINNINEKRPISHDLLPELIVRNLVIEHPNGSLDLTLEAEDILANERRKLIEIKHKEVLSSQKLLSISNIDSDAFFEERRFISERMGNYIKDKIKFKTGKDSGTIYYYENGYYHEGGEWIIKELVTTLLADMLKKHYAEEVIFFIKSSTYINEDEFNANKDLLCMENGIYNIVTDELKPHSHRVLFLNALPISYDHAAICPEFDRFLSTTVRKEDHDVVQEFFGYCFHYGYPIHKALMCLGDGSNGKTTLLNVLQALLGTKNISNMALQDLEIHRFKIANLFGKMANIYPEIPDKALKQTGMFKLLTGNDQLTAEKKFGGMFNFTNSAKLIFSCNKIPETADETGAFFRRWIFINFPFTFEGDAVDTGFLERMSTKEELSGIFNWAVKGLKRLLENGGFSNSATTEETKQQYIKLSNPVHAFILERCGINPEGRIPKKILYQYYKDYCNDNNLPVVQDNTFSKKLIAIKDIRIDGEQRMTYKGKQTRCWSGIKMKPEFIDVDEDKIDRIDTFIPIVE